MGKKYLIMRKKKEVKKNRVMLRKISKKGQSQTIETVLLILIVIGAISVIGGVVVKFVKTQTESTSCQGIEREIEIAESKNFTCYSPDGLRLQIHIGDIKDKISGIAITVHQFGGAETATYKINETTKQKDWNNKITNYNVVGNSFVNPDSIIALPNSNEERTYIIKTGGQAPDGVSVRVMLEDGKICDYSDELNFFRICP